LSKSKPKADVTLSKDWHTSLSALLLKSEKAPDSLERMLAACRAVISFLVQILKPGSRHLDTPTVILGQHYLSQREMGEHHRGDPTRVYLQELCSYDPIEQPVNPKKYSAPGHTDIARWHVHFIPKARGRVRKEGLIGSGLPYIEVQLDGQGSLEFFRHAESYTFTLSSLILASPLSEECPIDFDGTLGVVCEATGLQADLRFRAWKEGYVKGEVTRLAGEGVQRIARLEGRWDMQVHVHSMQSEATGLLYDAAEMPPPLTLPAAINLAHPGPRISPRLWTAVLEALLYADQGETAAGGKKAAEMVAALPDHLKKALMYEVPQGPK